jgi:hypothetical protein
LFELKSGSHITGSFRLQEERNNRGEISFSLSCPLIYNLPQPVWAEAEKVTGVIENAL